MRLTVDNIVATVALWTESTEDDVIKDAILAKWGPMFEQMGQLMPPNGGPISTPPAPQETPPRRRGLTRVRRVEAMPDAVKRSIEQCGAHVAIDSVWQRFANNRRATVRVVSKGRYHAEVERQGGRRTRIRFDGFDVPVPGSRGLYKPVPGSEA